jgi:hypothetical protein
MNVLTEFLTALNQHPVPGPGEGLKVETKNLKGEPEQWNFTRPVDSVSEMVCKES